MRLAAAMAMVYGTQLCIVRTSVRSYRTFPWMAESRLFLTASAPVVMMPAVYARHEPKRLPPVVHHGTPPALPY
jgi:hypothetical protein